MNTYHIHISGQVQGVGFRPFVVKLAESMNIKGNVKNAPDGVHMLANVKDDESIEQFIMLIKQNHPIGARITAITYSLDTFRPFDAFTIQPSTTEEKRITYISPDIGTCANCFAELFDTKNRRYRYPFITCTDCGPRLSIIKDIPYDRQWTSMDRFEMCHSCQNEYEDYNDRRFHSQTNSCQVCGIELYSRTLHGDTSESLLQSTIAALHKGEILAVKNNGGFLLICDATNKETITILRQRKNRPTKPFALLYPTIEMVEMDVMLSDDEKSALTHPAYPIVLCTKKQISSGICDHEIAPDSSLCGVMLANNPLLSLIAHDFQKPLIATSANISGSPILYTDEQIRQHLAHVTDHVLSHTREIIEPQDDSVWRFSTFYGQRIIIRRSRGMAPAFWQKSSEIFSPIVAAGADMKSCFGISNDSQIYISQFLGDLSGYDNQLQYKKILTHYLDITGLKPHIVVTDKHPSYQSTNLVSDIDAPIKIEIQHHKAHFAACLFEHDFMDKEEKAFGIIWDGVGYGDDGEIWGGEFFSYQGKEITRLAHFDYFPYLLGDKMSLQPRIAALALLHQAGQSLELIKEKFNHQEWVLYTKMLQKFQGKLTSSMGRIFDAVACILGSGDVNSYEGESAMMLEQLALRYVKTKDDIGSIIPYQFTYAKGVVKTDTMLGQICTDIQNNVNKPKISARFHKSLVSIIAEVATKSGCKHLFFSGGVFQNALLVDMIIHELSGTFKIHFHQEVSPNDECIALGQLVLGKKYHNQNDERR